MPDVFPLLADIGEVIKWAIGVLVFVFWIASQIMGEKKAPAAPPKKQPQPRRMPAPPPPGAGRKPPPRQQPVGGDPLADEIEQFLRRAAGKGGQKRAGAEEVEVLVPEKQPRRLAEPLRSERRPLRTARQPLSGSPPAPRPAQAVVDPATDVGDSVALHVREHIESGGFADRVSRLGEDVSQADDRIESRLHQTFDHKVGRLVHREAGPGDAAKDQGSPFAESIVTMFQNPESVRQVIVLNEVLKRPEERW